jgi:two-component system chemotaxis response regulator CheY
MFRRDVNNIIRRNYLLLFKRGITSYQYQSIFLIEGQKIASVIIVDDDPELVVLFERLLSSQGHSILGKASNGEEAITLVRNLPRTPDIILMDHRMPQMNGLEATKIILKSFPDSKIRVIFISADLNVRQKAIEAGAQLFLVKPVSIKQILATMDQI